MREQHTFVKIVTDADEVGDLLPRFVADAVTQALAGAPGLLRVEPAGTGPLTPIVGSVQPFADQPSSSFRCPEHRTDEHAASDHPRFNAPVDGQQHQPDPHRRTWGA